MSEVLGKTFVGIMCFSFILYVVCVAFVFYYRSDCVYEYEDVIGIVSNKLVRSKIVSASPIIFRREYRTTILFSDGKEIVLTDSAMYHLCEIGDEIVVKIKYTYFRDQFIDQEYIVSESFGY